jgi:mannose-1-phosphate guanylyltransferase
LKAVILVGGFGTRLRPLSCSRPKTLFPILNKPLLEWVFERLAKSDVKEAIMAVNQQTEFYIKQKRVPKHGLTIRYSRDPSRLPLGTAGPIKKAEKLIGHDAPFLVLNGDIFDDISYGEMIANHHEGKAIATIALFKVDDPSRYGVAELAKDNKITRFVEKPAKGTAPTNLINAGIYILSPKVFDYIPKGRAVSMEREVFPKLVQEGKLFGHVVNGLWMDIGKPEEYLQTNKTLLGRLAQNEMPYHNVKFEVHAPVALDKRVSIGEKSVIGPFAIIGRNVSVGKNARIRDSVILPYTIIDDYASVDGAIIGEGTLIGKNAVINKGCIVGDQAKIRDGVSIAEGTSICPGKEVGESILKTTMIC